MNEDGQHTEPEVSGGRNEEQQPGQDVESANWVRNKLSQLIPTMLTEEEQAELDKQLEEENARLGYTEDDDTDIDDIVSSGY